MSSAVLGAGPASRTARPRRSALSCRIRSRVLWGLSVRFGGGGIIWRIQLGKERDQTHAIARVLGVGCRTPHLICLLSILKQLVLYRRRAAQYIQSAYTYMYSAISGAGPAARLRPAASARAPCRPTTTLNLRITAGFVPEKSCTTHLERV